ncbi:GGDEF domain-containing protein [Microvirga splendida]|uniref:diguanylate cyclase n=1 Tax=Microvirga splendida TaxID=2795727 RepID=A0ABS0XZN1_9HYPH|nr:GGDEF domain-containing protein [Microvirga splendida]MBJ6125511.1 GGDEF domain-containing protein [Microvirga splendida]
MVLDPATLTVAFVLLSAVLGTLLIFSWTLNRRLNAMAWWGSAFWLIGIGIGTANLGKGPPSYPVLLLANAAGILAYGALYVGCRIFNDRRGLIIPLGLGVAIWAAAFPFIYDSQGYRLILACILTGSYSGLAAWELWRHAVQPLASQRVAVVLLSGLAVFNLLRGLLGISLTSVPWIDSFGRRWSSEMALFLVVIGPTLAFMFLSMAKERLKFEYKQAALVDDLTGIPNRRAFLQAASRLLDRLHDRPASCLLFDLDNFKAINDRHGHAAGDRILGVFARTLSDNLPKGTFGRLGGEEFAAILPMGEKDAARLAENIRHAFAEAGRAALATNEEVTVSIGCATVSRSMTEDLLRRADRALYRAKESGRNIVVMA